MRHWLLVFLAFCSAAPAHAVEIEEKLLEKGTISHLFPLGEDEPLDQTSCKPAKHHMQKCSCDANSSYPVLHSGNTDKINAQIKQLAEGYKCEEGAVFSQLSYAATQQEGPILSLVFEGVFFPIGGGGSCHSSSTAMVVNTQTDHVYALDEVLDKSREQQIKDFIISYFMSANFKAAYPNDIEPTAAQLKRTAENETKDSETQKFWDRGFYIKDGELFINFGYHIFGCADTNDYSVPISKKFVVNKDIAGLLKNNH